MRPRPRSGARAGSVLQWVARSSSAKLWRSNKARKDTRGRLVACACAQPRAACMHGFKLPQPRCCACATKAVLDSHGGQPASHAARCACVSNVMKMALVGTPFLSMHASARAMNSFRRSSAFSTRFKYAPAPGGAAVWMQALERDWQRRCAHAWRTVYERPCLPA